MPPKIDVVIVPFHDWRKCIKEGFRTRDSHFIQHLLMNDEIGRLVVLNRPATIAELTFKRTPVKIPGETIAKGKRSRLVQVSDKGFVFDFISPSWPSQLVRGKRWFFGAYASRAFRNELKASLQSIDFRPGIILSQNVFAYRVLEALTGVPVVFDAWDNFLKFPFYSRFRDDIRSAYESYSKQAAKWITNSQKNKQDFESMFGLQKVSVIKNGADAERFLRQYPEPADLHDIPRPIIGIGAKVTHLIDVELLNYVMARNRDLSFVLTGQVLDKEIFRSIDRAKNFYYLGDKHYDDYPAYVNHFDVCIVPYVSDHRSHGGDSIKVYEYLAARKPVVATRSNGTAELSGHLFIGETPQDFSSKLREAVGSPPPRVEFTDDFTWQHKTSELVALFRQLTR